jgi:TrmH family RNA methyltransferase
VADALAANAPLMEVFVDESVPGARSLGETAARKGVTVVEVTASVIKALSDSTTPQGVVATARLRPATLPQLPEGVDLVLVLAQVRDPGNAGTLVRSAVAAGAGAVVFTPGTVDPLGPKTARAAAGALFEVPVIGAELDDALAGLRALGFTTIGSDAAAPTGYDEIDLTGRVALVVGNEAWGMGDGAPRVLDRLVSIPMPGRMESLNVAVAGSILLFEAVRQRGRRLSSTSHE